MTKYRYDVISIDAPYGSKHMSRRDILPHLSFIIKDDFVILIDDAQRKGEIETIKCIEQLLGKQGLIYFEKIYHGLDDVCVIASKKYRFLCSL